MQIRIEALQRFFKERISDFRRIVYGAKGDVELDDVKQDALLMAHDIQGERGHAFDFDSEEDTNHLLARLWNKIVKYNEHHFRHAVKIDDDPGDDQPSPGAAVARALPAVATSDPAVLLELEQDAAEVAAKIAESYSEAFAYVILLRRFKDDRDRLAAYLCIAFDTLVGRFRRAAQVVEVQPSIFDGVERIRADFPARIERPKSKNKRTELDGEQWAWTF